MRSSEQLRFRHCEFLLSRHCDFSLSRHCEERSDEAISSNAPPRHCKPKGRRVCWREAISSLHIPVGVRCSGGIASPDCHHARNDEKEVFARNDVVGLQARNDASFRHCESLPSRHCEERSDEAISPIAPPRNCEPKGRRVCWREAISSLLILVGVRCSGGIASPDCYQARNDAIGLFARNDEKVACDGNFSQVNKEKKLKKNKIINQQKLNAYGN